MSRKPAPASTPLAQFITDRLHELGLKQVDFCRLTGFDQGLLSKLQSSVITTVNLESALRLADGLKVSPLDILTFLGKTDTDLLLKKLYGNNVCAECAGDAAITPEPLQSIVMAAQQAFIMGRDMTPILVMLRHLSASRRTTPEAAEHAAHGGHL